MEQRPPAADGSRSLDDAGDPPPTAVEPAAAEPVVMPAPNAWAWDSVRAPSARLPALPIEPTLRTAMDDVGWGFWRLLAIGAIGFAPIWAAVVALGDNPLSTLFQLLAIVPSAALLVGVGALRAGERPRIATAYAGALRHLLHYVLANLVVGFLVLLILFVPILVVTVVAVLLVTGQAGQAATGAIVVVLVLVVCLPVAYVSARFSLIGPLVVIEDLGVGEAITEGWRRTRHQVLRLLVVFVAGSIPGLVVAAGATLLAFGLPTPPVVSGLVFGLGYAVAVVVLTCVNVAAWERLGGRAGAGSDVAAPPAWPASTQPAPAAPIEAAMPTSASAVPDPGESSATRPTDRGPAAAIVLLVVGLTLVIGGSAAAVGKVGGWVDTLSGQSDGTITYGLNGIGCFQPDARSAFTAGDVVHQVADLTLVVPAGERLAYEVYADGELIDRGFEEPFSEETECLYNDLDTTDVQPGDYTFRYLWAADVVAEGTFTIQP